VNRRAFLGTLGLLAVPRAAEAQPAGKVPRIGWLGLSPAANPNREAVLQGLRELGYVEGRNVVIELPPGGLTLFCGVSDERNWELGKQSLDSKPHDWKQYSFRFTTDQQIFVDVRMRTEGPIRAWVDDIKVREVREKR
jgi:hypothetical protein